MELTEDQKKFLAEIEKEFSNRFSEKDEVYWEEHTAPPVLPPIIEPWYSKQRRNFDYSRRGRDNDHNGRNRDRNQHGHNRNDRYRGHGPNHDQRASNRSRSPLNRSDDGNANYSGGWNRERGRDRDYRDRRERSDHSQGQSRHSYR